MQNIYRTLITADTWHVLSWTLLKLKFPPLLLELQPYSRMEMQILLLPSCIDPLVKRSHSYENCTVTWLLVTMAGNGWKWHLWMHCYTLYSVHLCYLWPLLIQLPVFSSCYYYYHFQWLMYDLCFNVTCRGCYCWLWFVSIWCLLSLQDVCTEVCSLWSCYNSSWGKCCRLGTCKRCLFCKRGKNYNHYKLQLLLLLLFVERIHFLCEDRQIVLEKTLQMRLFIGLNNELIM